MSNKRKRSRKIEKQSLDFLPTDIFTSDLSIIKEKEINVDLSNIKGGGIRLLNIKNGIKFDKINENEIVFKFPKIKIKDCKLFYDGNFVDEFVKNEGVEYNFLVDIIYNIDDSVFKELTKKPDKSSKIEFDLTLSDHYRMIEDKINLENYGYHCESELEYTFNESFEYLYEESLNTNTEKKKKKNTITGEDTPIEEGCSENRCIICLSNKINCFILNCGHACLFIGCANEYLDKLD